MLYLFSHLFIQDSGKAAKNVTFDFKLEMFLALCLQPSIKKRHLDATANNSYALLHSAFHQDSPNKVAENKKAWQGAIL